MCRKWLWLSWSRPVVACRLSANPCRLRPSELCSTSCSSSASMASRVGSPFIMQRSASGKMICLKLVFSSCSPQWVSWTSESLHRSRFHVRVRVSYLEAGVNGVGQVNSLGGERRRGELQVMGQQRAALQQRSQTTHITQHAAQLLQEPRSVPGGQVHQLLSGAGCCSLHHQVTPATDHTQSFC